MIPQSLVFMFTTKCNFVCDHCSVSSGPDKNDLIDEALMVRTIDQAYELPSIKMIVFTGGEGTLFFDQLKKGIHYAHERGFTTRTVSNAWWAYNYENAKKVVQELIDCGLDELNISYDDFHIPYLDNFGGEQTIINAVNASIELGLRIVMGIVLQPNAKINSTYLRKVFEAENIKEGSVQYLEDYVFPLGRARKALPPEAFVSCTKDQGRCHDSGQTIVVLPDGKVSFCCGHALLTKAQDMFVIDDLSTGVTLDEIVSRMQRNVLSWMLHLEGPYSIFKELNINQSVHKNCEACFYLGTVYKDKLVSLASKKDKIFERFEKSSSNDIPPAAVS